MKLTPTECIIRTSEGKKIDRVPTMCLLYDSHPASQIMGEPRFKDVDLLENRVGRFILNKFGMGTIGTMIARMSSKKAAKIGVEVGIKMGFDAVWSIWGQTLSRFPNRKMVQDDWGNHNFLVYDDYGNASYYYKEPKITSPEEYDNWEYFPDPDKHAKKAYDFFKDLVSEYEDKICICGDVLSSLYQEIFLSVGIQNIAYNIRKNPEFIKDFISRLEEYEKKTSMAMMDAGVKVLLKGDDFSFGTGPQMNPKTFDKFWGPAYTRINKAIHERGGKSFIHSCGDNTELFDYFIKWGFDGGHAYETTSTVDVFKEKEIHGDEFTIIGGMGIDYMLTKKSKPREVVEKTKELLRKLGPHGRFILAPSHSHPEVDMEKQQIMVDTVKKYGKYPIEI
jgi:uroporphyrinogen decarboxylase